MKKKLAVVITANEPKICLEFMPTYSKLKGAFQSLALNRHGIAGVPVLSRLIASKYVSPREQ